MDLSLGIHAAFPIGKPCKMVIKKSFICRASQVSMEKGTTNLYKVLAIDSENVHVNEIKQAYRRLVLRYHPDVCPPSAAAECARAFMEIQKAYETLSDPVSRKRYDCSQMSSVVERGYEGGRFPKQVWMDQLSDLETQSLERVARKRMCF